MKRIKTFFGGMPEWVLPTVIVLLGAIARFAYLGVVPGGLHQDEAFVALNSFDLYHEGRDSAGHIFPVYTSSWGDGQSALYSYLLVPLLVLNGGIPTQFLVRLPQAVVGTLTIAATYGVMKRLFDRNCGLWTAFLLAICPWHVMMSRWALDANFAPGFLLFGFYFFVRGVENKKYLPLAGLFYGLSLYCYAVIWLVVPIMLVLQTGYCLICKKIRIDKWLLIAAGILFLLAMPLMLFVLVNIGVIDELSLSFMTIPKTSGFRGGEVADGIERYISNVRKALYFFVYENTGNSYDVLHPWGLYYDLGRIFIVIGIVCLLFKAVKSVRDRSYSSDMLLLLQLIASAIVCVFVTVVMHQINAVFLPLLLCGGYGIWQVFGFCRRHLRLCYTFGQTVLVTAFLVLFGLFQRDYYGHFRTTLDAYFAAGVEECVDYAMLQCEERGIKTITVEKGAQWPRLLLYTETLPSEYYEGVEYDVFPAPKAFSSKGVRINTRIDYENIDLNSIYIIYFPDKELFEKDYELKQFRDWYVAVPK